MNSITMKVAEIIPNLISGCSGKSCGTAPILEDCVPSNDEEPRLECLQRMLSDGVRFYEMQSLVDACDLGFQDIWLLGYYETFFMIWTFITAMVFTIVLLAKQLKNASCYLWASQQILV